MRLKSSLISLKSKLSKSCNRFISFFHARFRNAKTTKYSSFSSSSLLSCLCFLNTNKEQRMSQIRPRSSSSSVIDDPIMLIMQSRTMFPLTMRQRNRNARTTQSDMLKEDAVEEACRNFENYLIHMIVEDGKIDDLMDMEEILFYWKNLNSPIFIDLVIRFYGELCIDLFPSDNDGLNQGEESE